MNFHSGGRSQVYTFSVKTNIQKKRQLNFHSVPPILQARQPFLECGSSSSLVLHIQGYACCFGLILCLLYSLIAGISTRIQIY